MLTRFSPLYVYGIFLVAQGQLTPQSLVESGQISDIMVVLVICKYEEDLIKNEGARELTRFSPL